ncbi:hypothetical protein XA68_15731 [Ophiocordyceps unilateralis]|uniref:Uncharacterized protein n=1 Tax=Ophiocordyceps unilateralis TaxID=268505 RepID=A0A2A9P679_OPHUN|nr:hypothetical protein XA68_15731 [Ophiocordyceps unilateralis]
MVRGGCKGCGLKSEAMRRRRQPDMCPYDEMALMRLASSWESRNRKVRRGQAGHVDNWVGNTEASDMTGSSDARLSTCVSPRSTKAWTLRSQPQGRTACRSFRSRS